MFADYRVPQMLAHLGAIEYSPALLSLLRTGTSSHTSDTGLLSPYYFFSSYFLFLIVLYHYISCCPSQLPPVQSASTVEIASGSRVEMEIRGCAVYSLSLIVHILRQFISHDSSSTVPFQQTSSLPSKRADLGSTVNDVNVDNFLWVYCKLHLTEMSVPAHNTRSSFY